MTTADRIRNRRIELGLTQLEVAKRLGFKSKAAVCKVEKQGDDVTLKNVEKFADALNCSPSYLMGWLEDSDDEDEAQKKSVDDKEVSEFITLFRNLDENQQKLVCNLMKTFSSKQ